MPNFMHLRQVVPKKKSWYRRSWYFKIFSILALVANLFSERNSLNYFGRRLPKQHSGEVSLKLAYGYMRSWYLKIFLFLALVAILFIKAKRSRLFW